MSTIISVKDLSKSFGPRQALRGVTFEVEAGAPVGLVGPNGAGKTTLFSILCGFLSPTEGSVEVLDHAPLSPALRNRVSILPQDARFLSGLKVERQLAMLAELQSFSRRDAVKEAQRVLELVGLSNAAHLSPDKLSHGMLKRVAIAQAFIGSPELIMLDEPVAGLDPNTTTQILSLIRSCADRCTFIVSSHNLAVIESLCQSILILKRGELTTQESVESLVARTSVLNLRLEADPAPAIVEHFAGLNGITKVEPGHPGEHRLTLHYVENPSEPIEVVVIQALAQLGVPYREMTRGQSLDRKVAEITR